MPTGNVWSYLGLGLAVVACASSDCLQLYSSVHWQAIEARQSHAHTHRWSQHHRRESHSGRDLTPLHSVFACQAFDLQNCPHTQVELSTAVDHAPAEILRPHGAWAAATAWLARLWNGQPATIDGSMFAQPGVGGRRERVPSADFSTWLMRK